MIVEVNFEIEDPCKSCQGWRKVLNPDTGKLEPCTTCDGDGSSSGIIKDYFKQGFIQQQIINKLN